MEEYNDPRIGKEVKGLVTGNEYQVRYRGKIFEGTLEGREGDKLILRAGRRIDEHKVNLVDRIEIPDRYSSRFDPL